MDNKTYTIWHNNEPREGLYYSFKDAVASCEARLNIKPKEPNKLYYLSPMSYVEIREFIEKYE